MTDISIKGMDQFSIDNYGRHYNNIVIQPSTDYETTLCYNTTFDTGCYGIGMGRAQNLHFGPRCHTIMAQYMTRATFGSLSSALYGFSINLSQLGSSTWDLTFEAIDSVDLGKNNRGFIFKILRNARFGFNLNGGGLDCQTATHLQDSTYEKTIAKRQGGAMRLSYINGSDVVQYVNVSS